MNNLDRQYTDLLKDIMANGTLKSDRTGTGTISLFGRQIRHNMKDGFPLLTTKKMPFKTVALELLWFLRGETNIQYLVKNGCYIWVGDAHKNYLKKMGEHYDEHNRNVKAAALSNGVKEPLYLDKDELLDQEAFIEMIILEDEFAKRWGELGPIYGKQWRSWSSTKWGVLPDKNGKMVGHSKKSIDQIRNLIHDLKNNPDSRRLMVNAWNVGELNDMILPPCHYGFQCYTRELTPEERADAWSKQRGYVNVDDTSHSEGTPDYSLVPKRAISLMWNQRSVDSFLGLPFNLASYGLLLTLLGELVNMVPDELICNLGDTHLYLNHIDQAKEQIGNNIDFKEREAMCPNYMGKITPEMVKCEKGMGQWYIEGATGWDEFRARISREKILTSLGIPKRTREPYELPRLIINTEFWLTQSGQCDGSPLDTDSFLENLQTDGFCKTLIDEDFQLIDYKSHSNIKAPLSN